MSTKFLFSLAFFLVSGATIADEIKDPVYGVLPMGIGEGFLVKDMIRIDATLGLKTEQTKFQDRLDASFGKPKVTEPVKVQAPVKQAPIMTEIQPPAPLPPVEPVKAVEVEVKKETPAKPKPDPKPILMGIFGVSSSLYADVELNGDRVRFKKGQKDPVSFEGDFPYTLVSITPPCVKLQSSSGAKKICLEPSSRAGGNNK